MSLRALRTLKEAAKPHEIDEKVNASTVVRLPSCLRFDSPEEARAYYETFGPNTNPIAPVTSLFGPGHKLTKESILARVVINPTRHTFTARCQCLMDDFEEQRKGLLKAFTKLRRQTAKFSYQGKVIFVFEQDGGAQSFVEREVFERGYSLYDPIVGPVMRRKSKAIGLLDKKLIT